ncbi:cytochrome p450 [Holotrichia oblita]|uniref:Cytochrome p450 n=1 Tax=Holotrichia oblita TaxID=644536 RepID=A0ACB9SL47_HOLOL|nr:cytochrome p450 [Holotrichia oblita]
MTRLWNGVPPTVHFANFYNVFKSRGQKHGGVYQFFKPTYIPIDPEYVKDILIRDFPHFADRGIYHNEKDQPILRNLFFMEGNDWKSMRMKLSPTYTSGKMKMMFKTMLECSIPLVKRIRELTESNQTIDIKDVSARFTTDVIGSCAFGIECNSFESPNSEFRKYGKKIFQDNVIKTIKGVFRIACPNLAYKLRMVVFERDVEQFFSKAVTDTYYFRKNYNTKRNDFMQLLIELKDKENDTDQKVNSLTMNEVIAQAFIFFVAGFDTSATTLTFALFELAYNNDTQNKAREEVQKILMKYNGNLTYDGIGELKYMDRVIQETLRKYPPVALINRICTETYQVPYTTLTLEKGTLVGISVLGLHRDPDYYPDPDKFDPERFSDENKGKLVAGTYLPFGDGPRVCIGIKNLNELRFSFDYRRIVTGLRFGLMQVKIGLAMLLKEFEFSVDPRTILPLEIDLGFVMTVKGGIWLSSKRYNQHHDNQ